MSASAPGHPEAAGGIAWQPPSEVVERANSTRFARQYGLAGYQELLARSIQEPEWFWDAVVRELGLHFSTPYERVLDAADGAEWARWFAGGRLNLAWNCVDRHASGPLADREAIRYAGEDGSTASLTYAELARVSTRLAEGLASLRIGTGDRVGLVVPMAPEAVVALYAVARLGAVAVPVFSGFSTAAIAARLRDAGVCCVVTADSAIRRGRLVPLKKIVDEAVRETPSVRHVVVFDHAGVEVPWDEGRDCRFEDLVAGRPGTRPCEEVPSEHPVLVVYTSGTSGRPKGAVHVHGGFLVKVAAEVHFQADLHEEDVACWVSDMGWIMGPWMVVGAHACGATAVLVDGAPDHPDPERLWRVVARHGITFLGLSPTLLRALRTATGGAPPSADLLAPLRTFGCAGEPIDEGAYRWLFEAVGRSKRPIVNLSGGTEVAASFLTCDVSLPHRPCSLGLPALGMAVDVVDGDGRSVRGEVGELVCRQPWPGMTRGIWGDPERYLDTYWRRFPGMWTHGDWASVDADGYWFLHGRSDDTLNIAGKRIGPAELEAAALSHPAVVEAAAIGVPHAVKGEVAWLFCVARPGTTTGPELESEVADAVAGVLGRAFKPARVAFVAALPKTRSAKIVRRAMRARLLGADPGDLSSLENPEALEEITPAGPG